MPTINGNAILAFLLYMIVSGMLNFILSERSRIDTWAEQHPKWAAMMKIMRALGFDPWGVVAAASLLVKGRLPWAQRVGKTLPPPPFAKDLILPVTVTIPPPPPPYIPPVAALLLMMSLLRLTACTAGPPPACSPNNPQMIAKAAECRARVQTECKGIPDNQCPVIAECDQWGKVRCE